MFRNIIFVLMYHRHKFLDLISYILFLIFPRLSSYPFPSSPSSSPSLHLFPSSSAHLNLSRYSSHLASILFWTYHHRPPRDGCVSIPTCSRFKTLAVVYLVLVACLATLSMSSLCYIDWRAMLQSSRGITEILSRNSPEGRRKTTKNSVRTADVPAEILAANMSSTLLESYCYTNVVVGS
jgi:hypothetical protein